jgi:hypothetical protein
LLLMLQKHILSLWPHYMQNTLPTMSTVFINNIFTLGHFSNSNYGTHGLGVLV